MGMENDLSRLRSEIREIDDAILDLVAHRLQLAREVGELKTRAGLPVKNYEVEKAIVERGRARARSRGVPDELAVALANLLIDSACRVQEEGRGRRAAITRGQQRTIAIVGGLGRMGIWLGRFFEAFGHAVQVYDPLGAGRESPYPTLDSLEATCAADVIVLATPISATAPALERLIELRPRSLVFDICSLKTPLIEPLGAARKQGLRVASVHPMFGPTVESLSGRNIVFCETGHDEALEEAMSLFRDSAASLVRVPLVRHDEMMGLVLGLSHITSLVFAGALERSGVNYHQLRALASTTFNAQCAVAERVVAENPELYYEIQAENGYTPNVLENMLHTLDGYAQAIFRSDRPAFRALMEEGKRFFHAERR